MSQYDVAQICLNGHIRNSGIHCNPEDSEKYCSECGAETITQCPSCKNNIQGGLRQTRWRGKNYTVSLRSPPKHCPQCGKSYPWTESKIVAAIQLFAEYGNLDEEAKKTIGQDIKNIAKDVPETKLSAMRIKRYLRKCGDAGYEMIIEIASRTAAKILKE